MTSTEEKTPEEILAEELEAQKQDMLDAIEEEKAASERVAGLPEQYHDVKEYVGIGPLAYETKHGFIKVNSGDVVIQFEFPVEGTDPVVMEQETVVMSAKALAALESAVLPPEEELPIGLTARAARIGDRRRAQGPQVTNPIAETKPEVKPETKPVVGAKPTQLPA